MERAVKNAFIKMKRQKGVEVVAKVFGAEPIHLRFKDLAGNSVAPLRPIAIVRGSAITPDTTASVIIFSVSAKASK